MTNLAVLTEDDAARELGRRAGSGIVLAGDRSREFRNARLHSALVRVLRWGFPAASTGIVVLYVATMLQTAGWGKPKEAIVAPTIAKEIAMDNPRYEGYTKDGGNYVVRARTAIPDLKNPSVVQLNEISGEMFDARKSRTDLAAGHGVYDVKAGKLDLTQGVTVVSQSGMKAQLDSATMMTKEGLLTSYGSVTVAMPTGTVTAKRLNLSQKTREVAFGDTVVAHLVPPPKPAAVAQGVEAALAPAVPVKPKDPMAFASSGAPVDITSGFLGIHDTGERRASFSDKVRAVQGGSRLESEVLDIYYEGTATAPGAEATAATPGGGTKIKKIVTPVPMVLTQPNGDRVSGNIAIFDAAEETAVITGSVVVTSGADKRVTADKVEFNQKADTILLTGGMVNVASGRNELHGRRMMVDRKAGISELSSPAENGQARGRITARLYQGDGTAKPAAKKAEPAPEAAPAGLGLTNFKTDPTAPVDIDADRLRVEDARKQAHFNGDVKVVQGDFVLRTIEMIATYSGDAGLASVGGAGNAAPAGKTQAQLTKIEARGKVIVTSKQNQQVTGDNAVFDMKANKVIVSGKDVVVSQEANIVRGTKLAIDMATGESRFIEGRSSAVINMQSLQQRKPGTAVVPTAPVPRQPLSSSWDSSVVPARKPN